MGQVSNGVDPITKSLSDAYKVAHKEAKKKYFKELFIVH